MTNTIAIDFGTCRTKVAYLDPVSRKPQLLRFSYHNDPFIPSLFYYDQKNKQLLFGHDAEDMAQEDPKGVINILKRRLRDCVLYYNLKKTSPTELLTSLFSYLREYAKREVVFFDGNPPQQVYFTVPSTFGPTDKRVIRSAAIQAGFDKDKIGIVTDSVAAAHAWLAEVGDNSKEVIVIDCGGGSINWAYVRNQNCEFSVVSDHPPEGDNRVGGYDADIELLNLIKHKEGVSNDIQSVLDQRHFYFLHQIRKIKERYCRGLSLTPLKIGDFTIALTDDEIQSVLTARIIQQTCESLKDYLEKIKSLHTGTLPSVLLTGGSSRVKGLKETIESQYGCKCVCWEHSEYAAVLGAVPPLAPLPSALRYKGALHFACTNGNFDKTKIDKLNTLAREFKLSAAQATQIEVEVLGDSKEIIGEQKSIQIAETEGKNQLQSEVINDSKNNLYGKLQMCLKDKRWEDADKESIFIIRSVTGQICIDTDEKAQNMPDEVLFNLNQLWMNAGWGLLIKRPWVTNTSLGVTTVPEGWFRISTRLEIRLGELGLK